MNPNFRADLHCHSTCSDGTETPEQILQIAKQLGLSAVSITDHDTIDAYDNAFQLAKEMDLILLPGIEFSTVLDKNSVHILGYGFDTKHSAIINLCKKHIERRKNRNLAVIELLKKHGMPIDYQDVIEINAMTSQERSIGRPHIAHALVKKGYASTIQEVFNKYLGDERPCYVQGDSFTVDETIDVIHQAKGIAVIAHPHLIKNTALINQLLQKDIDGIECYYGKFLPEAHQRWIKIAKHRNLLITGGSDFHGTVKPNLNLGSSWINQDLFQAILDRLKANHS